VSTVYAKRALADVLDDIEVYAKWAELGENRSLGMQGIFLDETPSKWDDKSAKYLQNLGQKIKSIKGFGDSPLVAFFFHYPCGSNIDYFPSDSS
jgi:hypothetical protein